MRAKEEIIARIRTLAGDLGANAIASRSAAQELLRHNDGNFRIAGLMACGALWHGELDQSFKDECRALAQNDPNLHVRVSAIDALGGVYAESKDEAVRDCLNGILRNPCSSEDERLYAQCALNKVQFGFSASDVRRKLERLSRIVSLHRGE